MYHIKLVDRLSKNETRSRVYPAIRYSIRENKEDDVRTLLFWERENVCKEVDIFTHKSTNRIQERDHCFEAYVMNDEGQTIEVIS